MTRNLDTPGHVWAHVGQPFVATPFDVLIIGAGRMGSTLAYYLSQLAPQKRVLVAEQGGLPNEDGASILAAGVWAIKRDQHQLERAFWVREQLEQHFGNIQFQPRSYWSYGLAKPDNPRLDQRSLPKELPEGLLDPSALMLAHSDSYAATYRPGMLAQNAMQAAIGRGTSLMLNTRVVLRRDQQVTLERLTVTNTHQIVVHETHDLSPAVIVVAAGADGPAQLERELGHHTRHGRAYVQYPHLKMPSHDHSPVLEVGGLLLRPQHGHWTLYPKPERDPHGYVPTGGQLSGVPVGLRRELLEELVALIPAIPALGTEKLQVSHSLSDLQGSWVSLPAGGLPQYQQLAPGLHLLLGGPEADTLGLAAAYDLAKELT